MIIKLPEKKYVNSKCLLKCKLNSHSWFVNYFSKLDKKFGILIHQNKIKKIIHNFYFIWLILKLNNRRGKFTNPSFSLVGWLQVSLVYESLPERVFKPQINDGSPMKAVYICNFCENIYSDYSSSNYHDFFMKGSFQQIMTRFFFVSSHRTLLFNHSKIY